jgi:hypothetical protein
VIWMAAGTKSWQKYYPLVPLVDRRASGPHGR